MTNDLVKTTELQALMAAQGIDASAVGITKENAEEVTGVKGSIFFPFIQLLQKTSLSVGGGNDAGHFLLKKGGADKTPANLGSSFEAVLITSRAKATFWDGKTMQCEYSFGPGKETPGFVALRDLSRGDAQEYRAGIELLLFVPSLGCFATYFGNTPSQTIAIEQCILPYQDLANGGAAVRIFSEEKKNAKGTWFTPSCADLSPEAVAKWEHRFTTEHFMDSLKSFINPKVNEPVEIAEDAKVARKR